MTSIPQTSGAGLAMLYQSLANAWSARAGESAGVTATGTFSSDGYGTAPGGGTADSRQATILDSLSNGAFGPGHMPDFSAAVTGPDVTPQFDGGYNLTGIVDQYGEVQFYGETVSRGSSEGQAGQTGSMNAKALAVSFAPGISTAQEQALIGMGMNYLQQHMSDAENASGQWSGPTFDVRVG